MSVLQTWVEELSFRKQGVLILALRGPDGTRKESVTKPVVRTLRACVMNSGRDRKPMARGTAYDTDSFMRMDLIETDAAWNWVTKDFHGSMDEMNLHYFQHLIHAAAICGIDYPDKELRNRWWDFYVSCCKRIHVKCETSGEIDYRLRDGKRIEEDE